MALELTPDRVLPDGIHDCTLDDVRNCFGQIQRSTRRITLCDKLERYLEELRAAGIPGWLIVDGSFVMECVDEPDDIDLILILSRSWNLTAELKPYQYNLLSKRNVKRNFRFDLFAVREGSIEEANWIRFFSKINTKWYDAHGFPVGSTKGLVRIPI